MFMCLIGASTALFALNGIHDRQMEKKLEKSSEVLPVPES